MLKAILFDVDGTLAETEEFHRHAFNAAFSEHGVDATWSVDDYRVLLRVTGGKERLARYFSEKAMGVAAERIRAIHATKNALYARQLAQGAIGLRPGVRRLIEEARAEGLALGIATTTSSENLAALLEPLLRPAPGGAAQGDWRTLFDCVVAGDQVARKKPAPDVYVACLEQLGIAAHEVVAIEDSPQGVAAARGAGIAVLVTPSRYTGGEDFGGAAAVVPDLGEPGQPWPQRAPGFPRRWVDLAGLRGLLEPAQGMCTSARTAALRAT
jgi:beta-phosphoglucomutase-like phosphatase (HAD superfamily)